MSFTLKWGYKSTSCVLNQKHSLNNWALFSSQYVKCIAFQECTVVNRLEWISGAASIFMLQKTHIYRYSGHREGMDDPLSAGILALDTVTTQPWRSILTRCECMPMRACACVEVLNAHSCHCLPSGLWYSKTLHIHPQDPPPPLPPLHHFKLAFSPPP